MLWMRTLLAMCKTNIQENRVLTPEEQWQQSEDERLEYEGYCRKIIQGLAACIPETEEDAKLGCSNCPYGCCKADAVRLPIQMIEDIRAVLKRQEPRLVTYDDFHSGREDGGEAIPCWKEARSKTRRSR